MAVTTIRELGRDITKGVQALRREENAALLGRFVVRIANRPRLVRPGGKVGPFRFETPEETHYDIGAAVGD